VIDALLEAWGLKALPRTGWGLRGIHNAESVAAHSWGIAALVLVFLPDDLDTARALSYATLHDLAEVRVGDLTPSDGVSPASKHALERQAMVGLCTALPRGAQLLETWDEYEAQADPEALFVRQLDRLDMALQALLYERTTGVDTGEFLDSAQRVMHHPTLVAAMLAIREARSASVQQ
jgi:putative hydrolase of HD superfamily